MKHFAFTILAPTLIMQSGAAGAMTDAQRNSFFQLFHAQVARCYQPPLHTGKSEKARVEVYLAADGSLSLPPKAVGPAASTDIAQAALRAIRRCAPFRIPATYAGSHSEWKRLLLEFE
jgi:colicin import membrane protein